MQGWGGRVYFCELEPQENEIKYSNPIGGVGSEDKGTLISSVLSQRQGHRNRERDPEGAGGEAQRYKWVEKQGGRQGCLRTGQA